MALGSEVSAAIDPKRTWYHRGCDGCSAYAGPLPTKRLCHLAILIRPEKVTGVCCMAASVARHDRHQALAMPRSYITAAPDCGAKPEQAGTA